MSAERTLSLPNTVAPAVSRSTSWRLAGLGVGAFAVGTDGFVIAGILPRISSDLRVSVTAAGQLVTVFAITYALGAPLLAIVCARWRVTTVLRCGLVLLAAANALAAAAPEYWEIMTARVLAAGGASVYLPTAAIAAAGLVDAPRRGRALAWVTGGLTLAIVIGVPIGSLIGQTLGWRATFVMVAGISAAALSATARMPPASRPTPVSLVERIRALGQPTVLTILSVTLLAMLATYTSYTYAAPLLKQAGHARPDEISGLLLIYGAGALGGNFVCGYATDRWGARRTLSGGLAILMASLAALTILAIHALPSSVLAVALASLVWGFASWTLSPPQIHRLLSAMPKNATIAVSLNSSAIYLGIGLGAVLGGLLIRVSVALVPLVGVAIAAGALVTNHRVRA